MPQDICRTAVDRPAPAGSILPRHEAVRILLLGDSMTSGIEANPQGFRSFRGRLHQMLTADGIDVDFIGSQSSAPAIGGDPHHEGYGGAWIGPGGNQNNLWDRLDDILSSNGGPDVIVMAFGWNSVYNEPKAAPAKYRALVERVAQARPSSHLVLATLSPQIGESEAQSNDSVPGYARFNAVSRQLACESDDDRLHLVDLAQVSFARTDYWDVIHWLQPGADKAAAALHAALRSGPLKP